jgi:RNA polymerase sigma-70 factor (ECF subfamily)
MRRTVDTDAFESNRGLLFGLAYRMLGSAADAEDVLQEARLRWRGVAEAGTTVDNPRAFLVTVVSRLCLDELKSARARRETYVGPWLPEPVFTPPDTDPADISTAFLLLLERLSPPERAAFLLHDVFDYDYAEVAAILGKGEDACRQLASRARRHLHDARPRPPADPVEHSRLLGAFAAACRGGDVATLEQLLAADVVLYTDGGGKAAAARNPIYGARDVIKFSLGVQRFYTEPLAVSAEIVNGLPALVVREHDVVTLVLSVDVIDGRIAKVYSVRNPDKLARLG